MSKSEVNKILIVQLGKLGDLILTTPLFSELKKKYKADISLLVHKRTEQLLEVIPYISNTFIYDKKLLSIPLLLHSIRKHHFDLLIDVKDHYSSESYYIAKFSKAKIKIGFNQNKTVFNYSIPADYEQEKTHAVFRNLNPLEYFNSELPINPPRPKLIIPESSINNFKKFLGYYSITEFAFINYSASSKTRYWAIDKWKKLINEKIGSSVSIVISGLLSDKDEINQIVSGTKNTYLYISEDIKNILPAIESAKFVISPDTSVTHIASAFNKPQLAIFSNYERNTNKFLPLSDKYVIVLPTEKSAALSSLGYEEVATAFDELCNKLDAE